MLGIALAGAGALLIGPPTWVLDRLAARFPGCLFRVATREPMVALTIDDSPDDSTTPAILDELRRHGGYATFFLIAGQVRGREALVRRMTAAGHEIGNHFMEDRPGIRLEEAEFARDLDRAHEILAPFGAVRWARPGSGWYSGAMVEVMRRKGYECALGSVYPYDATVPWVGFASWHILRNVRPGAIIVLHDRGTRGWRTARILRSVLPALRERGYRVVTLSQLVSATKHRQFQRTVRTKE
ncbi:MAG TPA: polysaccharide deacetylase family protein [Gemmatimonadales bacterium]|nr:polysaccharide deacetylase family protein [Gemmatimonadales bacterium]